MEAHDLAEQVLAWDYHASKNEWGEEMLRLVRSHNDDELTQFVHERTVAALGAYIGSVKAAMERRKQQERILQRGISTATRRPVNPYLSVRGSDGSRQGLLWIEATPVQFMEAVFREETVVRGRAEANAVRMQLAELIQQDDGLQDLSSLKDVCSELHIDPDTLGLEELPSEAA